MKTWTDGTRFVTARNEKSARRKIEAAAGFAVGPIRIDDANATTTEVWSRSAPATDTPAPAGG